MKSLTNTPSSVLKPLSLDDLKNTIGGDGDTVDPNDLLGTDDLINEDIFEL